MSASPLPSPSPELLLSLTPAVLRDLVATFAPPGAAPPAPKATTSSLAHAIFIHGPSRKLAPILSTTVARFCTRAGRLALYEAAIASSDPRAASFLSTPCADVAALLALEIATTPKPSRRRANRRLFALATRRVERNLLELPTYELVAETPLSRDIATIIAFLKRALGPLLVDHVVATDPDGTVRLALYLRQPAENRLVLDEATGKVVQRRDVPIAVDQVRIFPGGKRVAITTAMPELLRTYADAFSLSVHASSTLRPLQDVTRETLERAARAAKGVARIDVVAVRYRLPNGARIEVRAPDALDPSLLSPRAGYIDRTTLRITMTEGQTVDAFLQLPHRVEISDMAFAEPVRAALAALDLFAPGALPDDARSLAPYEHGDWRWITVLGSAARFEAHCKRKLLLRALASHVATHEHRMHGAAYVVRDVPGEGDLQYALAEDRSLGARLVTPKDRVVWRLDLEVLAAAMRADLGAEPGAAPLAIPGILDLGLVTLASGKLRFIYVMADPPAASGWVDAVRRACGIGVTAVILVPKGHAGDATGMLEIELDVLEQLGAKRIGRALGKAAEALGVGSEVEVWRRHDEDIIVEQATQRAWVTGVLVPLKDRPFGLVLALAKAAGVVATKEVGASISGAGSPDVTARKAKSEVEAQTSSALRAAGVDASIVERMIVVEGRKGYRLGVSARIV